jgi:hypothetical protein
LRVPTNWLLAHCQDQDNLIKRKWNETTVYCLLCDWWYLYTVKIIVFLPSFFLCSKKTQFSFVNKIRKMKIDICLPYMYIILYSVLFIVCIAVICPTLDVCVYHFSHTFLSHILTGGGHALRINFVTVSCLRRNWSNIGS